MCKCGVVCPWQVGGGWRSETFPWGPVLIVCVSRRGGELAHSSSFGQGVLQITLIAQGALINHF